VVLLILCLFDCFVLNPDGSFSDIVLFSGRRVLLCYCWS
jgi:hypothetical protein